MLTNPSPKSSKHKVCALIFTLFWVWESMLAACHFIMFLLRAMIEILLVLEILLCCGWLWQLNLGHGESLFTHYAIQNISQSSSLNHYEETSQSFISHTGTMLIKMPHRITANELSQAVSSNINGWMAYLTLSHLIFLIYVFPSNPALQQLL